MGISEAAQEARERRGSKHSLGPHPNRLLVCHTSSPRDADPTESSLAGTAAQTARGFSGGEASCPDERPRSGPNRADRLGSPARSRADQKTRRRNHLGDAHRGMTPPADTPDLMGHQTRRPLVPTIPSGPLMCIPRRGLHFCGFRRSLPQRPSRRCSPQALITLRKRAHEMNSPWCLNSDLCSVQNHEERWSVNLPAHPISRHTTVLPLLTGANVVPVPEGTPHCRLPSARTAEKMSKAPRKTLRKMPGANRASHPPRKTPTIEPSAIGSTVTRNG